MEIADDIFDKIEKYYQSNGHLSPKELEICARWELIFALYLKCRNRKSAISKYLSLLAKQDKTLSLAQADRDLRSAERLFMPLVQYSKDFLRHTLTESALEDIKQAEQRARKATTVRDWTACMAVKDAAAKRIIKAEGLDQDTAELPDFSRLVLKSFTINVDSSVVKMIERLSNNGTIDVTDLLPPAVEKSADQNG